MPIMHLEPAVPLVLTSNVPESVEMLRPDYMSCAGSPEGLAAKSNASRAFEVMPAMHPEPAVPLLVTSNVPGAVELVRQYVLCKSFAGTMLNCPEGLASRA